MCGPGLAGQCLLQTVPARYIGITELNVSVEDEVLSDDGWLAVKSGGAELQNHSMSLWE